MIQQRKKRNSSKVNLTISIIFHSALILVVGFFAAREESSGKGTKHIQPRHGLSPMSVFSRIT